MSHLSTDCRGCGHTLWFHTASYTEWFYGLCLACDARLYARRYR